MKQQTQLSNQEVAGRLKHLQGCMESLQTALVKFEGGALTASYELTAEQIGLQRQLDEVEAKVRSLQSEIKAKTANIVAIKSVLVEKFTLRAELCEESELKELKTYVAH